VARCVCYPCSEARLIVDSNRHFNVLGFFALALRCAALSSAFGTVARHVCGLWSGPTLCRCVLLVCSSAKPPSPCRCCSVSFGTGVSSPLVVCADGRLPWSIPHRSAMLALVCNALSSWSVLVALGACTGYCAWFYYTAAFLNSNWRLCWVTLSTLLRVL
jgi:hypothetical protein